MTANDMLEERFAFVIILICLNKTCTPKVFKQRSGVSLTIQNVFTAWIGGVVKIFEDQKRWNNSKFFHSNTTRK